MYSNLQPWKAYLLKNLASELACEQNAASKNSYSDKIIANM